MLGGAQWATYMFLLAIEKDGETHYWSGGDVWSVHAEEAARFVTEADADATIDVFKRAGPISLTVHVVPLPEGTD
jgi:hypothetical protein